MVGKKVLEPHTSTSKVGIILGAAVWETGPSLTLLRRTMHGAVLYHKGLVKHLVACGGLGKHPPSEAEVMSEILLSENVPRERIFLDKHSTTTGENIANARAYVSDAPIIIISDWYHTPRARLIARRAGFNDVSWSSPSTKGVRKLPQLKSALREIPAFLAYYFRIRA